MKNVFKVLGFIAILAVVGFGFTACDGDGGGGGSGCSHEWGGDVVTAPTCTTAGFTTQTCSKCSTTQKINPTAATGLHSFTDAVCSVCNMGTGLVQIETGTLTWNTSRTVTLSAFKMGKYEITQEFYEAIMGVNPSFFSSNPATGEVQGKRPVEKVTWFDAIEFCNKLSEKENLTPVYTITGRTPATGYPITSATVTANWEANGYRLPTEAQWEYACRAGSTADYGMGASSTQITTENLGNYAWYEVNSSDKTHEVGKKPANVWGLFDMHGNVWEWCWDWYGTLPSTNETDYTGAAAGTDRVRRGGSWYSSAENLVSAGRGYGSPNFRDDNLGFRVARP